LSSFTLGGAQFVKPEKKKIKEHIFNPADGSINFVARSALAGALGGEKKDESEHRVVETVGGAPSPQSDLLVFSPHAESASCLN